MTVQALVQIEASARDDNSDANPERHIGREQVYECSAQEIEGG